MKRSTDRILTTHVGSLPRPKELLDAMRAKLNGQSDEFEYERTVSEAVQESVRQQVQHGLDVVSDGEQSKIGFFRYIGERLDGFEARPRSGTAGFGPEVEDFPEYYEQYFKRAMTGGSIAPAMGLVCVSPVEYRGQKALQHDIDNLKAATKFENTQEVFMPAVAPSGVGRNEYYDSDEAYFFAVADALRTEYQAIVDAGFVLQVDDPWLSELYSYSRLPKDECREQGEMYVSATTP